MPLNPQAQLLCDLAKAMPEPPADMPLDERVGQLRVGWGLLVAGGAGAAEPIHAVSDHDAGGVPVRVYRPAPEAGLPIVVFFHGGGWVIGNVEQYDVIVRQLANASGAIFVSVDYRLAPEHPFPAALDDCRAALAWSVAHAAELGGDASRIAVMGDSAGGNLAAECALWARDEGAPALALQVLVYPVTDCDFERASYTENASGYLLEAAQMRWFFECYTSAGADPADWRISPLRVADVAGVAPAVVLTAEFDPLRDEGEAYADRLQGSGIAVERRRYDGLIHGFFGLSGAFDASRDAIGLVATALRRAFGTLAD